MCAASATDDPLISPLARVWIIFIFHAVRLRAASRIERRFENRCCHCLPIPAQVGFLHAVFITIYRRTHMPPNQSRCSRGAGGEPKIYLIKICHASPLKLLFKKRFLPDDRQRGDTGTEGGHSGKVDRKSDSNGWARLVVPSDLDQQGPIPERQRNERSSKPLI